MSKCEESVQYSTLLLLSLMLADNLPLSLPYQVSRRSMKSGSKSATALCLSGDMGLKGTLNIRSTFKIKIWIYRAQLFVGCLQHNVIHGMKSLSGTMLPRMDTSFTISDIHQPSRLPLTRIRINSGSLPGVTPI